MVTIIKAKTKKEKIKQLLLKAEKNINLLKASKYCGKVKLNGNPLSIQKRLRDEWN